MRDIVERLRSEAALTEVPKIRTHQMMDEAANEITRLRDRVDELEERILDMALRTGVGAE